MLIGYTHVSTDDSDLSLQRDALVLGAVLLLRLPAAARTTVPEVAPSELPSGI